MQPAIAVGGLVHRYGAIQAVAGISFEVHAGEIFGLLGPNGAGKTTILDAILGLIEPQEGEITVLGIDVRLDSRAARAKVGAVLQATGLQDKITPKEALEIFAALHSSPSQTMGLLDRFDLCEKQDAAYQTLSGGQKQRLALALAFIGDPAVLLLDEPTTGLDPKMRREVQDHIRAMRLSGRTVLLATHDMDEAEQLCDRIGVIAKGRIVAQGDPKDLIAGSDASSLEDVVIKLTAKP
jgi:ABC-2 type transport system ATP-binding protein